MDVWTVPWAAGFFDGEGSTIVEHPEPKRTRDCPTLKVMLTQHGVNGIPDTLSRFVEVASCGRIHGPYTYAGYRTPRYYWYARNRDAEQVLRTLWPFLGEVKRSQAQVAIAKVNETWVTRRTFGTIDRTPLRVP